MIREAKKGKLWELRRVAALDAVDEALGRSLELGRAVVISGGRYPLTSQYTACAIAGTSMIRYVAEKCAKLGLDNLIVGVASADMLAMVAEAYREGCTIGGNPEMFSETKIVYLTEKGYAHDAGMAGLAERENAGAMLAFGMQTGVSIFGGIACRRLGAMFITSHIEYDTAPWGFLLADHALISGEVYAAGAIVSDDKVLRNMIVAEDFIKLFIITLISIGFIVSLMGSRILLDILAV